MGLNSYQDLFSQLQDSAQLSATSMSRVCTSSQALALLQVPDVCEQETPTVWLSPCPALRGLSWCRRRAIGAQRRGNISLQVLLLLLAGLERSKDLRIVQGFCYNISNQDVKALQVLAAMNFRLNASAFQRRTPWPRWLL